MKKLLPIIALFFLTNSCFLYERFDILLLNGIVFDGESLSKTPQDVGIKDGKIIAIGDLEGYGAAHTIMLMASKSLALVL